VVVGFRQMRVYSTTLQRCSRLSPRTGLCNAAAQAGSESRALRSRVCDMQQQLTQAQQAAESTQVPRVLHPILGTSPVQTVKTYGASEERRSNL